jgi:hypothetical protein
MSLLGGRLALAGRQWITRSILELFENVASDLKLLAVDVGVIIGVIASRTTLNRRRPQKMFSNHALA